MLCACGCTTPGQERVRNNRADWVEFLEQGDRAPDDGFWLTRESFMMLYEAAEKAAVLQREASRRVDSVPAEEAAPPAAVAAPPLPDESASAAPDPSGSP